MARAELAERQEIAVLAFGFLLYEEDGVWFGRSILTSHVSEGPTPESAIDNLTLAIDAALIAAKEIGVDPRAWYEGQIPDELKYVRRFLELVTDREPERRESTLSDNTVIRASVVRAA